MGGDRTRKQASPGSRCPLSDQGRLRHCFLFPATKYAARYRVLTRLDAKKATVKDTAASGRNTGSGGHLADEAAAAPDSMPDCEHANGDPEFHGGPPNTRKGKRPPRGRKRKAPGSEPEPEPGGSANQGNTSASTMRPKPKPRPRRSIARVSQLDADTTAANDISQFDPPAPEDPEQPGGSANQDHSNTSTSTKRPRPRAPIARVSQLDVDTAAKDASQNDPILEGPEQPRTSAAADVTQGKSSAALTDFATSDLSDLTDIEDVPPSKKARTKRRVVKAVAYGASVRTPKPRASRRPPKLLPQFTMRTRSSAKNNIDIRSE